MWNRDGDSGDIPLRRNREEGHGLQMPSLQEAKAGIPRIKAGDIMNGLRLKITWNDSENTDGLALTATVLLPDKEYKGMRFYYGSSRNPRLFDVVMIDLIGKLSAEGWATRIIDDNNIEVVRLARSADIKHETCRAPKGTPISELM